MRSWWVGREYVTVHADGGEGLLAEDLDVAFQVALCVCARGRGAVARLAGGGGLRRLWLGGDAAGGFLVGEVGEGLQG